MEKGYKKSEIRKVLIIDDEKDFTAYLFEAFERKDVYSLFVAHDGEAGVRQALIEKPDVILLDIVMPGMSGFDVLQRLKEHQETVGIPVIMLTALGSYDARLRALRLYSEGYLEKPCSIHQIFDVVDYTLERRKKYRGTLETN